MQGFQTAYPGIELQVKGEHIRDGLARIIQERDGGIYSQDVMLGAIGAGVFQEWIPRGVLAPLEPDVVLPDARDDAKWADGFRGGWVRHRRPVRVRLSRERQPAGLREPRLYLRAGAAEYHQPRHAHGPEVARQNRLGRSPRAGPWASTSRRRSFGNATKATSRA